MVDEGGFKLSRSVLTVSDIFFKAHRDSFALTCEAFTLSGYEEWGL